LTDKEREIIKSHSEMGHQILNASNLTSGVAEYVLYHHERWDGMGYPKGLKAEDIPQLARIIGLSDAFVSMMESRIYREAKSFESAIQEIKTCSTTQFDPKLVSLMLENKELFKSIMNDTNMSALEESAQ